MPIAIGISLVFFLIAFILEFHSFFTSQVIYDVGNKFNFGLLKRCSPTNCSWWTISTLAVDPAWLRVSAILFILSILLAVTIVICYVSMLLNYRIISWRLVLINCVLLFLNNVFTLTIIISVALQFTDDVSKTVFDIFDYEPINGSEKKFAFRLGSSYWSLCVAFLSNSIAFAIESYRFVKTKESQDLILEQSK